MAKVLQHRRGTTSEHSGFTGAVGEFTYDTTEKRIVAHDGATKGGIPMAKKSEVDAIDVGVTSFNGYKGAVTYSAPVSSVNGQTGAVTVGTVRSVNGATADASGNVAISLPSPQAYVTETYRSGSTWYRKWSDGFIEQGGTCIADTVVTVTFPVAFASVVLDAWVCAYGVSYDNAEYLKLSSIPTLTSFVARGGYTTPNVYGAMKAAGYWYACGY